MNNTKTKLFLETNPHYHKAQALSITKLKFFYFLKEL